MKKPVYIRCPRCELNYIQKKDKYCSVCKAEMEAKKDEYDEDELELCPICKTNYIQPDDIMCPSCLKEHKGEEGELSGEWEDYMTSSDEDDESVSMYDELGEMASVNDLTKAGMLDDDDEMGADIGFDDEDLGFDDEEFSEEAEEIEEGEEAFDDDFDDEDFDDDDDSDDFDDEDDFDDDDDDDNDTDDDFDDDDD